MRGARIAKRATSAKLSVYWPKVSASTVHRPERSTEVLVVNNAIELIDFGRESAELNYGHMIQAFHRFLVDHMSSEGNSFPHNPNLLPSITSSLNSPAPAPITQLLGIDAKNIITCLHCKAVREKENMTHVIDMTYPRKVRRFAPKVTIFHE